MIWRLAVDQNHNRESKKKWDCIGILSNLTWDDFSNTKKCKLRIIQFKKQKKKKCCNYQLRADWAIMSKWPEENIKGTLTKYESAKWSSSSSALPGTKRKLQQPERLIQLGYSTWTLGIWGTKFSREKQGCFYTAKIEVRRYEIHS